jgi:hypothetical protein
MPEVSRAESTPTCEELAIDLDEMLQNRTLINSVWAAYNEEGRSFYDAPLLVSPISYGVDSGWRTLRIAQWVNPNALPQFKNGSGDFTDGNGNEIRYAIFQSMINDGMLELVAPGSSPELDQ